MAIAAARHSTRLKTTKISYFCWLSEEASSGEDFRFLPDADHFFLVLEPAAPTALGQFMQWLLTSHVRRYHKHYGSGGVLSFECLFRSRWMLKAPGNNSSDLPLFPVIALQYLRVRNEGEQKSIRFFRVITRKPS